jgi:hypothetical protein
VPQNTLQRRLAGIQPQLNSIPKNRLLSPTKEQERTERIISMDQRGMPPALLASQHGQPVRPGKNWVKIFINRNNALKLKYNRKYNYKRAECKDVGLIQT